MLMSILMVVAATMRLWSLVGAQPLCRARKVRTGKVFNGGHQVQGDVLYFPSTMTCLIKHPCEKTTALYLGRQVFFTRDNFESSLLPLTIPTPMMVGQPEVTSAHFAGSRLLLVVSQKVYMYDYNADLWNTSEGIQHPVSHISGDNCCFAGNTFCLEISNSVFAYLHGEQISQANIYVSNNGGFSFQKFTYERQATLVGSLGGIFFLHSLSQVGLLVVNNRKGMFAYSDHPLTRSLGLAFDYNETLQALIPPGQRGLLILWSQNSLLSSLSAGQIVDTIQVQKGGQTLHPSIFGANVTVHNIAVYENGLAVLTREDHLYYGRLGIPSGSSSIIKFPDQQVWSQGAALMFLNPGKLQILTPLPDAASPAYDFRKCVVNIQAVLTGPDLHAEKCKIELMYGAFKGKMYTLDMNSQLEVTAIMIPRPGASLIPQVMVSNPYSLGLKTSIYEFDNTYAGNVLYRLDIRLKQQHHWGWFDPNFTSSIKRPTLSTLTVDVANKEISCMDLQPLTALISIGCDQEKKIIVQKWQGEEFKALVEAEFVLREVHGLSTFSYALTAEAAGCSSQPQNWSSVLLSAHEAGQATWSRENYVSCHSPSSNNPLRWPDVQYQILGGRTDNRIIFKQWNGIYIFHLSVLDPYYSYCHLETTFSIYVYGAYPLSLFAPGVTIVLLVASMLLAVWLAHMIPRLLCTAGGHKIREAYRGLCRRCSSLCHCCRGLRC
ncbi:cation channel sperm-associated protein subunit delta isoform X6 [Fukomys damarensis]|uniref:cation channel sperm-associated protein subunit delta isoform X6 n=1 Tax=Fukomys damarensis TaxID=885580 RepID=UPI0008FF69E9|nr:cation channel sperm-associated protein subunit delta isoform X6 [Fukomys damarensis]